MVMYGAGKLRTLIAFPTIFKGKKVKVAFDRPVAMQIDGETVLDVTEYTVDTAE